MSAHDGDLTFPEACARRGAAARCPHAGVCLAHRELGSERDIVFGELRRVRGVRGILLGPDDRAISDGSECFDERFGPECRQRRLEFLGIHLPYRECALEGERTGVQTLLHPHDAHARDRVALENRTRYRRSAAVMRQQRGMDVDAARRGRRQCLGGKEHAERGDTDDVSGETPERLGTRAGEGQGLDDRNAELQGAHLHGGRSQGRPATGDRVGARHHREDVVMCYERIERRHRERRRPHEYDAHAAPRRNRQRRLASL